MPERREEEREARLIERLRDVMRMRGITDAQLARVIRDGIKSDIERVYHLFPRLKERRRQTAPGAGDRAGRPGEEDREFHRAAESVSRAGGSLPSIRTATIPDMRSCKRSGRARTRSSTIAIRS